MDPTLHGYPVVKSMDIKQSSGHVVSFDGVTIGKCDKIILGNWDELIFKYFGCEKCNKAWVYNLAQYKNGVTCAYCSSPLVECLLECISERPLEETSEGDAFTICELVYTPKG